MIKKTICFSLMALCSSLVSAKTVMIGETAVEIGEITANGSGCPDGTVSASATDDNTQVAILFSTYNAITNASNTIAISDCNIAIPLSVEPGFTVGVVNMDWRGTTFTQPGAFVNFHREFFFSGSSEPAIDSNWVGSGFENFLLEDRPVFVHYSGCDGAALITRVDTSATVIGENSLFSLRSADVSAKLLFTLQVTPC